MKREKKCILLFDNLTILCIRQFQNEKTEEIIQVVLAAYFLQLNINMKYEKWVNLCQKELLIRTILHSCMVLFI